MSNSSLIIRAIDLNKQVDNAGSVLTILQHIHFDISLSETVAIIGASGSGKSTLLGLLAGLDLPTSGSVQLAGQDIFSLDEDERAAMRAQMLGFVFQTFQLLPALTALENVMLPLELLGRSDALEKAKEMLNRVGLVERLKHYPKYLSGGEQQRVALARAFITQPKLLFADEPTGNLDAVTGASIIELMFTLNAERGTTLVLVTHDEAIAKRCGRVLRLEQGRLV